MDASICSSLDYAREHRECREHRNSNACEFQKVKNKRERERGITRPKFKTLSSNGVPTKGMRPRRPFFPPFCARKGNELGEEREREKRKGKVNERAGISFLVLSFVSWVSQGPTFDLIFKDRLPSCAVSNLQWQFPWQKGGFETRKGGWKKRKGCKWGGIVMRYCEDVPVGSLFLALSPCLSG